MIAFLVRRIAHAVAVVAFATVASFVLLQLVPGDPLLATEQARAPDRAAQAMLRERLGLDRPVLARLTAYASHAMRGDLGTSIVEQRPVSAVLGDAIPATLTLSGMGLLLAVALGIGVGTLQGWRPHDIRAAWLGTALTALYALPEVVLAIALLGVFAVHLRYFPVGGLADPLIELTGDAATRLGDRLWHLVLPASALALSWGAAIARQQRVAMQEIAGESFVRTARAKGVPRHAVWRRHALRPALSSTVALVGTMLPVLAGGTVVIEALFSWPGMGSLMVRAVGLRDYPVVAGAVIVVAAAVATGSLLADLLLLALDPRTRDAVAA